MHLLARAVEKLLRGFTPADRAGMVENGKVTVKCEFCGRAYEFEPGEVGHRAHCEVSEATAEGWRDLLLRCSGDSDKMINPQMPEGGKRKRV
jgi:hypothetical protein